jgi:hypothetical protein
MYQDKTTCITIISDQYDNTLFREPSISPLCTPVMLLQ